MDDIKCTIPEPQDHKKIFFLDSAKLKKGDSLDNLIFLDEMPMGMNKYRSFIEDVKFSGVLSPICNFHSDLRYNKNRTIIHCKLEVLKSLTLRNDSTFRLGLTNGNKKCAQQNITGYINIIFEFGNKRIKRSNIFNNNSKIFRTAAPFARVMQPINGKNTGNYQCTMINSKKNPFGITHDGIVYVIDPLMLKNATTEYLGLNITWQKNNVTQYEEVSVRIVDEPEATCTTLENEEDWVICSSKKTAKSCMKKNSCGLGTGGLTSVETRSGPHRCMWRGDKNPGNHETHLYSTCTSDTKYCPDGTCDSLEMLAEDFLCPQDCTKTAVFPTKLNEITGRGVDRCNAVLVCEMGCTCIVKLPSISINANGSVNTKSKGELVGIKNSEHSSICGTECMLLASGGVGAIIFVILIATLICRISRKSSGGKKNNLTESETPFSEYVERNTTNEPLVVNFQMSNLDGPRVNNVNVQVDLKWRFPRHQIFIEQVLGEGEFGKVLKAKAFKISGRPGYSAVAVKTLKEDSRKQDYNDLFSEYQLLKEVNHPHVIQLLGVCTPEDGPLYIILEYCVYGSLRNYLRKSRRILSTTELAQLDDHISNRVKPRDILSFARQIASGMSYLSDIKLVHRDLAARNILLADNKVCKISDFGLTRDIYEDSAYFKKSKGRVPVKWMAPESLADHLYTTKSDVWSFGILIWELITLGSSPYPGIAVHNLYNLLKQGYRMERPPNCSTVLYALMNKCWNLDSNARPTFLELYHCFDNLLTDNINYLDLSDNAIINRSYFSNLPIDGGEPGSSDLGGERIYRKHDFDKTELEKPEKLLSAEELKDNSVVYETPVKFPRPVIMTSYNDAPGEYTDMNAKQQTINNDCI
ncbi:unnamed protein product [Ceutorhynchus assimilis]|uniref:Protein kinase domain-containing protein n=1 Tax=Ceutorhynchus assimilis TaxID=467358 RepID=A0A9N9Q8L9_9CUCU|nr:unnamed protein product [Ceutorhynchus assimilis]